jgi:hypothetical protein
VIVAVLPKAVGSTVTDYDNFFPFQQPNEGAMSNHLMMPADKDRGVKFLYDRIVRVGNPTPFSAATADKEPTRVINLWIKRKGSRDIVFDQASQEIINKPLAVYLLPYEQFSTSQLSNVTSFACSMRLYFKDV